jgi:alkylation response protein AidB-like acyl-CoA dehydrogenase
VDFRLTEDQRDLVAATRALLAGRFPRERLRAAAAGPGFDRAVWADLTEAGLFALRLPESLGGAGLRTPEAVLAFEEAGRALVPGPLVGTHLAAGLLRGEVVAVADTTRRPLLVAHLDAADAVLVLERGRVLRADPAKLRAEPVASVDPLTPLAEVRALPVGDPLPADAFRLRRDAALLTAALQSGIAGRATARSTAHARTREQFGRPIGSFQAVQHLCADMLARVEVARAAVYAASLTGAAADVAAAKLLADEAAVLGTRDCVQVHGGMGFTWEADVHLYLKRAWVHATAYADAAANEETLAAAL